MKKLYFLGLGLILFNASINAQSITNVQASLSGNKVIIAYDLLASDKGQKFNIVIKNSSDNFVSILKEVTGDVGANQSAGIGKRIMWDARKELGMFKGNISFEITATVTFTPLKFVQPSTDASLKIGKPYTVKWIGGTLDRNLKLELLKNNSQVMDMGNIDNTGSYTWNVPKTMQKGEKFQFKLLDPTMPNDAILSAEFKLKKVPILIYAGAGAVAVGVLVAVLAGGGGSEDCQDVCNPSCANYNPSDASCIVTGGELATPPPPPGGGN